MNFNAYLLEQDAFYSHEFVKLEFTSGYVSITIDREGWELINNRGLEAMVQEEPDIV